jgi:LysR family transcriptional regulator, hydrogen peroxide-inducible genes activator
MAVSLPSLRQLRQFVALAEHAHFGRAATACHVTQSTLSAGIKELETTLGATLVDRTKRHVVLTPLGREILERARRVLQDAEDLVRAAEAGRMPLSGQLQFGVIPTIGPFLLPRILPRLRKAHPKLQLYLTEDLTGRLLEDLHEGRVDVVLLALPYDDPRIETQILFDDTFQLVSRRDDPLAATDHLSSRHLDDAKLLLLRDGHCLRDHVLSACSVGAKRHLDAFEGTSLHTLVQMVDNGLGVTLLPQLAIDGGILKGTNLAATPLAEKPARQIALAWRKGTARADEFRLLGRTITDLSSRTRAKP